MVEQSLGIFLASALLISLSGVLSPGPMTAAVIGMGGRHRLAGLYVSLGHGIVEAPLILLLFFGAGSFLADERVRIAVGLAGGAYLLYTAWGLLRPARGAETSAPGGKSSPALLAGVFLSMANPWFLLWWATIGLGLVMGAAKFGAAGVVLFIVVHWLADLAWYTFLSAASHRGVKAFGLGLYRKASVACGLLMVFFGGAFIHGAVRLLAAG